MKKSISVLLAALFFSMTGAPPATAVSAGDRCARINVKLFFKKTTYICVKSGKKLVWKKVSSPKTPAAPTPTPSPTPVAKELQDETLITAISQLQKFHLAPSNFKATNKVESGFSTDLAAYITGGEQWVLERYGSALAADARITSILAITKEFTINELKAAGASDQSLKDAIPFIESAFANASRPTWAFATTVDREQKNLVIVYMSYPNYTYRPYDVEIGAHETYHLIQSAFDHPAGNQPCWLHEGQPSLVGVAYSASATSLSSAIKGLTTSGLARTGADLSQIEAPQGWVNNSHGPCLDSGEYSHGRAANALLISKFGVEKNLNFLALMNGKPGDGVAWKVAFETAFGQSVTDFYVEARKYLIYYAALHYGRTIS